MHAFGDFLLGVLLESGYVFLCSRAAVALLLLLLLVQLQVLDVCGPVASLFDVIVVVVS
jgi:hypothetical protein